ncbi:MAG: hypothetical protein R3350_04845, partial [Saprospiraceae bacterium]|nr:hypothetical protein [Saprospiraceae bacterium]
MKDLRPRLHRSLFQLSLLILLAFNPHTLLMGQSCPSSGILYVNIDATAGANDGSSWTDAYTDLQDAIDLACDCGDTEIWVAEGTYLPTRDKDGGGSGPSDRNNTFYIDCDLELYGGFDGTETARSQRDYAAHITTLSGDL